MEALHLTIIQETQDNEKGTIIKAEAQVGANQGPYFPVCLLYF